MDRLFCEIALWGCIVQLILCRFYSALSYWCKFYYANSFVRILLCRFRNMDPIVQIPLCRFYREIALWDCIMQIVLCILSCFIVQIPSNGFYSADCIVRFHYIDFIMRILLCKFHQADSIILILLSEFYCVDFIMQISSYRIYCRIATWNSIVRITFYRLFYIVSYKILASVSIGYWVEIVS